MEENDIKKIERYIRGDADENDKIFVESLLAEGENNLFLHDLIRKDWELIDSDSNNDLDSARILEAIYKRILKNESMNKQKAVNKLFRVYLKVAAILLPLLLVGAWFYSRSDKEIQNAEEINALYDVYAPQGSRVSFTLPDGTRGMLNSGSHLSYSLPFSNNRLVNLDGEAWFSVKHDELNPFEIQVNNSKILVLGTKLNVSAYREENYTEVVLQEGNVDFYKDDGIEKVTMHPSERLVFQNGEMNTSVVDTAKFTSWLQGKLVFRGDSMPEVVRRIERWYNVEVNLEDKELERYSFRATFQDDSVEEVIRCLALTSPISYKISPRILSENGIYKKTEISIYLSR